MTAFSTATASNLTTENPLAGFAGLTAPSVTALAGKFHIALPGNVKVEVFGTFTYAAGVPTAGIITAITWFASETAVRWLTGLTMPLVTAIQLSTAAAPAAWATLLSGNDTVTGSAFDDTLAGYAGKDVIDGGAGNDTVVYTDRSLPFVVTLNGASDGTAAAYGYVEDTLRGIENVTGGAGADTLTGDGNANILIGGLGNDILRGGDGADTLNGDGGIDTVDYADKIVAIAVALNGGIAATVKVAGSAEDTVTNIENIRGGSADDMLTGDALANTLEGGAGNDTLTGLGGLDVLDGGTGTDTASYAEKTGSVVVTLNTATNATVTVAGVAEDTLRNIENVIGGGGNDTLTGDAAANALSGGLGDDALAGLAGNDALDGGGGTDTASFAEKTVSVVVTLNTATNATATIGGVAEDTLRNIENLIGGKAADTLTGDALANLLTGREGADTLDGAGGIDTASYAEKTTSVTVTLSGATAASVKIGGVAEDTVRNIENIIGGTAADTLTGDGLDNVLTGNAGDDLLTGLGGKDVLDGGAGLDTASYAEKTGAVVVTLNTATDAAVSVGGVAEDTVRNIENVTGGTANDTLSGDANANILIGDLGNDTLRGGGGADTLKGGDGIDTADYSDKIVAVVAALNGDTIATVKVAGIAEDIISNIENLRGGAADDTLTGDALANTLEGGAGNDTLTGLGGLDVLDGGAGADTASYAEKTVSIAVTLNTATNATVTVGGVAEDTLRNVENVIGGAAADSLTGDTAANALTGGLGDDALAGLAGNDVLDGGGGTDTASFAEKTLSVVVTLNVATNATATIGGIAEDTLRNIENLIGGKAADTLTGDAIANLLTGREGADTLDGAGGIDTASYAEKTTSVTVTLSGATAASVKIGGVAEDTVRNIENITGGTAADTLTGDGLDNTFTGNAGDDVLTGLGGKDVLDGGAGLDTASYAEKTGAVVVTLNSAVDVTVTVAGVAEDTLRNVENVTGGSGDDTLTGDGNANTLNGGAGADRLRPGQGADTLDGGAGIDLADYSDAIAGATIVLLGASNGSAAIAGVAEDVLRNVENILGSAFNDTITGDAFVNALSGGVGNDVLQGGGAADVLDGGAGADTASFADRTLAVVATLNGGVASTVTVGGLVDDSLVNIENLIGGTADDVLTGDFLPNRLRGGAGKDTLDGGGQSDIADYSDKTLAVVVTLDDALPVTVTVGGVAEDTLISIEGVVGGSAADVLTGNIYSNSLDGGAGDDTLDGGAGNDFLFGGAGKDTLDGGHGLYDLASYTDRTLSVSVTLAAGTNATVTIGGVVEDTLRNIEYVWSGSGNDTLTGDALGNQLDGGAGDDTFAGGGGVDQLQGAAGNDTVLFTTATTPVVVTLRRFIGAHVTIGGVSNGTVADIENIVGGQAADTLFGDPANNSIDGGAGNDALRGGGGIDVLDGGTGTDTADYADQTLPVAVTLNGATLAPVSVGGLAEDTIRNIENIIGGSGNDTINGDSLANQISGGLGDDTIQGGGGLDTLDGGAGIDTLMLASATMSLAVTLAGATATQFKMGGVANDTISNFENVVGGTAADTLTGDGLANQLDGQAGNDVLNGADGNDLLIGGTGLDTLDGGAGIDTASFAEKLTAVAVTLNGATNATATVGGVAEDTLVNIENIIGGVAADTLTGDALANRFSGRAGNDILDGGAGVDTADYSEKTAALTLTLNAATNAILKADGVDEDTLCRIENIIGGAGNDTIFGDAQVNQIWGGLGDDLIQGGGGLDTLDGGAGIDTLMLASATMSIVLTLAGATATQFKMGGTPNDVISNFENVTTGLADDILAGDAAGNVVTSGAGNDTLTGFGGADTLDGGVGIDTAVYSEKTQAVLATLNGAAAILVRVGGLAEDTLRNIENLTGGTADDTLRGDALANVLIGGAGNDTLSGVAGLDTLDGGVGLDTASFAEKLTPVVLTLNGAANATATVGGVAEDTIVNIENIIGGAGDDILTGDVLANVLTGGAGNDILTGGAGDTLDGGTGLDTVSFASETQPVVLALAGATVAQSTIGGLAGASVSNIENVIGGTGNDILTGDTLANLITGGAGNDTLSGGAGLDTLDGGTGLDTVSFAEKLAAVVLTLNGATSATATVGGVADDTIVNIENITGGTVDDTLTGDGLANVLAGRAGNDILDGGAGLDTADYSEKTAALTLTLNGATNATATVGGVVEDTLRNIENVTGGTADDILTGDTLANVLTGGAGNDTLSGGAGLDTIDGGTGTDTASYADKTLAVIATLNGATAATVAVGGVAEDTIVDVENLVGGTAADTLTGDGLANQLDGQAGSDVLSGAGGDDFITGGTGNDTLDGGTGLDTASFAEKAVAVVITLNGATNATATVGGVAEDTLRNIENIIGGTGADILTGDTLANVLTAGGGNDTVTGGGGSDTIDGGAGTDTASFAEKAVAVVITLNGATNATATVGGVAEDTLRNIENVTGGTGDDILTGDTLANVLTAGAGNDALSGGGGLDTLDGGAGTDTASFADKTLAVVTTLNGATVATVTVGGVAEDTIVNVENLAGGTAADTLTGDGLANQLDGQAGNDTLSGAAGDDVLTGGTGNDTLDGGTGLDTASFAEKTLAVVITLNGATNATATVGGVAEDTLRNIENVTGGTGDDIVTGDTLANVLAGGGGIDTFNGGGGLDTLTGGAGVDKFLFSATALGTAATKTITITDFDRPGGELLNLAAIDANTILAGVNPFTFIGTAAFSGAAGQLRWAAAGANSRIEGDIDANGVADLTIMLNGINSGIAVDWFKLV